MALLLVLPGWIVFRKTKTSFVERWVVILYGSAYTTIVSIFLATIGFLLKLFQVPVKTGFINDIYFLIYYFSIAWFIYGFEKIFQPKCSKIRNINRALLMLLAANYAADTGLVLFIPTHSCLNVTDCVISFCRFLIFQVNMVYEEWGYWVPFGSIALVKD